MSVFDLDAYLARIGYSGSRQPTLAAFRELHLAHATSIPFENLDILLGQPIRIDLASIQDKLVRRRRGGYCFEHNQLFAAALEAIGFRFTYLAARVRYRAHRVLPRTHVLLLVEAEGINWIADVGFGTIGLLQPIELRADQVVEQFNWRYRLIEEPETWVLQTMQEGNWESLYAFTLMPQEFVDLEMANHYVSTFPESRFVQTLIAQRSSTSERLLLRNLEFIVDREGKQTTRTLRDQIELLEVLSSDFDLPFPKETRFRLNS